MDHEEIIIDIFARLPVKSLMRFKCLTKFFNSLVSESSDFAHIHRCRSMTRSGGTKLILHGREFYYTAELKEDRKTSGSPVQIEDFDELPFRITVDYRLNCVNGLFCIWEPLFFAAIFNPSTREVRFLPDLNDGSSMWFCSFGFDPEEKKYKVLFTTKHIIKGYIKHWVITLGVDESWRETQSITPPILCKPGVCINRVIYKFVFQDRLTTDAFDVKIENSKNIDLLNASNSWWYYELLEVKGKLAIMDYEYWQHGYVNLWILEQTQKEEEWKIQIIDFPSMWWKDKPLVISSCTSSDEEIVFILDLMSDTLCFSYDVTRQSLRKLEINGLPRKNDIEGICSYVETLVIM